MNTKCWSEKQKETDQMEKLGSRWQVYVKIELKIVMFSTASSRMQWRAWLTIVGFTKRRKCIFQLRYQDFVQESFFSSKCHLFIITTWKINQLYVVLHFICSILSHSLLLNTSNDIQTRLTLQCIEPQWTMTTWTKFLQQHFMKHGKPD